MNRAVYGLSRTTMHASLGVVAVSGGLACAQTFVDVAPGTGLSNTAVQGPAFPGIQLPIIQTNVGYGAAVGDYDSDGDLDIYVVNGWGVPNKLFRNELGNGTIGFTDVTEAIGEGLGDTGLGRVAHFADLDNDGHLDLLLICDHNPLEPEQSRNQVFRNTGEGTFEKMPQALDAPGYLRCGASLADMNHDGLLDVYISVWAFRSRAAEPMYPGENILFQNNGEFVFADVSMEAGVSGVRNDSFTSIFTDFDGDGGPDLFVAIDHNPDLFYSWAQNGFVERSAEVGLTHVGNDMGVACADVDDDGDLDLYVTNITDGDPACRVGTGQGNAFHINQLSDTGELVFLDEAVSRGVANTEWGWGTEFVDIDNDTDLDLLVANGFDNFLLAARLEPCVLLDSPNRVFVNDGDTNFESVDAAGFEAGDDSRALIAFDYDRDGDQDILITNIDEPMRLLQNTTSGIGHWLDIEVRQQPGSNHFGIGVRIDAVVGAARMRRDILAGESFLAGTPTEVHFGLGAAETVDALYIYWTDGSISSLAGVAGNQFLRIEQPVCACERNGDEEIDSLDLAEFVGVWLDGSPAADFDASGDVVIRDLLLFLECWFQHCE